MQVCEHQETGAVKPTLKFTSHTHYKSVITKTNKQTNKKNKMLVHEYYLIQFNKRLIISKNYWTLWEVAICKGSPESHFAFLHFFSLGMVLITASCTMSGTSVHNSSGTLSIRYSPLNLFLTSTV